MTKRFYAQSVKVTEIWLSALFLKMARQKMLLEGLYLISFFKKPRKFLKNKGIKKWKKIF
jgi:hypothetical protein